MHVEESTVLMVSGKQAAFFRTANFIKRFNRRSICALGK